LKIKTSNQTAAGANGISGAKALGYFSKRKVSLAGILALQHGKAAFLIPQKDVLGKKAPSSF
jgi:hypothetical protein